MKIILKRLLFYLAIVVVFFLAYLAYLHDDGNSISKGIPIPTYEAPVTALIIIDVQEGITGEVSSKDFYTSQASGLIKNLNAAIDVCYENKLPIVYVQQQTENWFLNWATSYEMAIGQPGVQLDSRLKLVSLNQYPKRIMDSFSNPLFEKFLQEQQVNRLIITGVDIAYCANRTTKAALNRGYEVVIIEDGVISENEEMKEENLAELREAGAEVILLEQLQTILEN